MSAAVGARRPFSHPVRRGAVVSAFAVAALAGLASASAAPVSPSEPGDGVVAARPAGEGGRIVTINAASATRLETMDPDGSDIDRFTGVDGFVLHPGWTPDATGIVFVTNAAGPFRLTYVRADGTGLRTILRDRKGFEAFTPTVTPDGERVVFARCPGEATCSLYSVGLDGTGLTRLTHPDDGDGDFWPDVSASGDQITFDRFGTHGIIVQTWVMDADGGDPHAVTAPALEAGRPRWTPDGRRILVTSQWVRSGENIVSMRADGSDRRRLTSTTWPHNAAAASASPSGRKIMFVNDNAYPDLQGSDMFVMRADGTGKRLVRKGVFFETDWAVDSGLRVSGSGSGVGSGAGSGGGEAARAVPQPAVLARYARPLGIDAHGGGGRWH